MQEMPLVDLDELWRNFRVVSPVYLKLDPGSLFIWHQMNDLIGLAKVMH